MRLITFQPLKVIEDISKNGEYIPKEDSILGKRVFCLRLDKDTMENIYITAPSMPQVLIELEVEDSRIEVMDYLEWVNYVNGHRKYTGKYADRVKYKEYALDHIKSTDIVRVTQVSNSSDPDIVQDAFMDKHFEDIEKLSGYSWKRNGDICLKNWWSTAEAYEFVTKITRCMMPDRLLTDSELDETHRLIRNIYRID